MGNCLQEGKLACMEEDIQVCMALVGKEVCMALEDKLAYMALVGTLVCKVADIQACKVVGKLVCMVEDMALVGMALGKQACMEEDMLVCMAQPLVLEEDILVRMAHRRLVLVEDR